MAKNFPNLQKNNNLHIKDAPQVPRIIAKRPTNRHIIVKMLKVKGREKNLEKTYRRKLSLTREPNGSQKAVGKHIK